MLKIGTKCPDFSLPDQNGKIHSNKDLEGKTIIYFYPKDSTSGCTKQAVSYSEHASEFASLGYKIIGISKDSVASHKKFEEKFDLKITLLSDTEKSAISLFDVWKEKKLYGKTNFGVVRTTYIIDENGVVVFANDKVKAADDADFMLNLIQKA